MIIKNISLLALLVPAALLVTACSVDASGFSSDAVVLDVRCAADTDCPSGFECENEVEHGVDTSFCVAHNGDGGTTSGQCPAGYELEVEHGGTFCKPHGGGNDDNGGSGNSGSGNSGSGNGNDDNVGGGTGAAGATCQTNADCAAGLECETEIENGVTTSTCKAHGGGN